MRCYPSYVHVISEKNLDESQGFSFYDKNVKAVCDTKQRVLRT